MESQQQTSLKWSFEAFEKYERGVVWYAVAGLVVGLLLVYAFATNNILFGLLVLIIIVTLFVRHIQEPGRVVCEISEKGVMVGRRMYVFDDLESFSIIKTSDGRILFYVKEKRGLKNNLSMPLLGYEPSDIRNVLKDRVVEDTEHTNEPLWDALSRLLKL